MVLDTFIILGANGCEILGILLVWYSIFCTEIFKFRLREFHALLGGFGLLSLLFFTFLF